MLPVGSVGAGHRIVVRWLRAKNMCLDKQWLQYNVVLHWIYCAV